MNNWRLQGRDYFRIMAATGQKTMTVLKRYNTVSQKALKARRERKTDRQKRAASVPNDANDARKFIRPKPNKRL